MHTYTLTITKDDFLLEFKSTDKTIVEHELGVWINAAEEYLDELPPYSPAVIPQPEKIELGQIVVERKAPQAETYQVPPVAELLQRQAPQPPPAPKPLPPLPSIEAEQKSQTYKISNEAKEILHKAIHKPKQSMKEILAEKHIKEYKPTEAPKPAPPVQTTPLNLPPVQPIPTPVVAQSVAPQLQELPLVQAPQEDFTEIFNQKVVQEQNNSDKFMELLSLQNIHNRFDCLIACAYHLIERENFERFTLKQINALSKALLEEAIEHDTLKEALERRFIKIVPDYTGIATTMEYTLTDQGIKYFEREISNPY